MHAKQQVSGNVLLGSPQQMIDGIAKFEEAGIDELGLYINIGLKPHQQTLDEMQRFMEEVAPHFKGSHNR